MMLFLCELQIEVIMRVARDPGIITALIGGDDRKMCGMPWLKYSAASIKYSRWHELIAQGRVMIAALVTTQFIRDTASQYLKPGTTFYNWEYVSVQLVSNLTFE